MVYDKILHTEDFINLDIGHSIFAENVNLFAAQIQLQTQF